MDKIDYIVSFDMFRKLTSEKIKLLSSFSELKHFDCDCLLAYEGDSSNKIMFLCSGAIKSYKLDKLQNELFLEVVEPYSLISSITSLNDSLLSHGSNLETLEPCIILEIDYIKFKELILPHITLEFMELVLQRVSFLNSVVNKELVFDSVAKVAFMLHDNLKSFNSLNRKVIASRLNLQAETLSRVLKKLQHQRVIEILEDRKIIIVDNSKLSGLFL